MRMNKPRSHWADKFFRSYDRSHVRFTKHADERDRQEERVEGGLVDHGR